MNLKKLAVYLGLGAVLMGSSATAATALTLPADLGPASGCVLPYDHRHNWVLYGIHDHDGSLCTIYRCDHCGQERHVKVDRQLPGDDFPRHPRFPLPEDPRRPHRFGDDWRLHASGDHYRARDPEAITQLLADNKPQPHDPNPQKDPDVQRGIDQYKKEYPRNDIRNDENYTVHKSGDGGGGSPTYSSGGLNPDPPSKTK